MSELVDISRDVERGLELISNRNMHFIMRFLYENYGVGDIKKTMLNRFCTPQALTECLNMLESAKLIRIEQRREPQNVFYIRLTPEGLLFEKADILETYLADNLTVDTVELNRLMDGWNAKKRLMIETDPSSERFFKENRIGIDF